LSQPVKQYIQKFVKRSFLNQFGLYISHLHHINNFKRLNIDEPSEFLAEKI